MKRTNQEYLILILSALAAITVSSFSVLRFMRSEWLIAGVDLFIGISMVFIFVYVWITNKAALPGIFMSLFTLTAAVVSVYIKGVHNIYWVYPAIVATYYLLPSRWAIFISILNLVLMISILYGDVPALELSAIFATILMTSMFGYFYSKNIEEKHNKLTQLAIKDSLTGVGNRRALDAKLSELVTKQARRSSILSLIMIDIDNFKLINDDHGHIVGDQILVQIARIIEGRIRSTDTLYRFGGEEFVIVPLDMKLKATQKLAEQLRILVENHALVPDNPVTISLGVAEYKQDESSTSWMKRADEALYRAKNGGRNQVCIAE